MNDGNFSNFIILSLRKHKKDFSSFENVQNKIIDKQNHKLLNKIFNNFDWK